MDDAKQAVVLAQLAKLRADYLARLPAELAKLKAMVTDVGGGMPDRACIDELHHHLHKLAGSGGSFGLAELSAAARVLEQRVQAWLAKNLEGLDAAAFSALLADLDALGGMVANPTAPTTFVPPPVAVALSDASIRVWLVEADPDLGLRLQGQLETFNYAVRLFARMDEVERAAEADKPDLLIMDVMFETDGETPAGTLAGFPAVRAMSCPILFIASNDHFKSRLRAAQLGAVGYLLKPIDIPQLVSRMGQFFNELRAAPQRVLIVDDDADLAAHMSLVLQSSGMQAQVLHQPETIMAELAAFQPDLVLMDVHMPGYTGPELAAVIRQHDRWTSLPIVYLSAETDLERQIAAMSRGGDDFLIKPISDAQLVLAVRVRVARARQLADQINKDSLTGLLKHASIKEVGANEIRRALRLNKPVTLAMIDIDHFKQVNDTYGHAAGDVVISALATLLRQRLRQSDPIGRYGGEEFLVVLPECTGADAQRQLDDIRQRFADLRFSYEGRAFSCTLSAGHASLPVNELEDGAKSPGEVFKDVDLVVAADSALYEAKRSGRNRVCAAIP